MTRLKQDEQGAVLAIVALSLIALMGMVILVIDVGGLLVMKRRLVTTADSAALAAAQQCAQSKGQNAAIGEANVVAEGNVDTSLGKLAFTPSCTASNGEVTARYRAGQKLFFAPILGLGEDMTVSAPATAIWGPANSGNSVPLMVGAPQFAGNGVGQCDFPPAEPPSGQTCAFWYDSDQIGNAAWGWVNLNLQGSKKGWDVESDITCPNVGAADRAEWIANNYPDPLPLNWPAPTYVCADTGFTDRNWEDLRDIIPSQRLFPVNDPDGTFSLPETGHGQVDKDGNKCTPQDQLENDCVLDKYDMIGFTSLLIIALYDGNDPAAIGTPGALGTPSRSGECDGKKNLSTGEIFAIYNLTPGTCPRGTLPTTVTPEDPFVYTKRGNDPPVELAACATSTETSGCDYYYNSATFEITWRSADLNNVNIDFDWFKQGTPGTPGSPGACSSEGLPPPPDTMAKLQDKCLVTEWVGFQSTGQDPGTGPDLGVRAIRLAE